MRRIFTLLFAAALLCAASPAAAPKLRVGVALPLTGLAADYGQAYRKGIELALADDAAGAARLELRYEDHQYDTKSAVSAARKLLSADRAELLAVWGWAPSDAIAPLSNELGGPMLLSSINPISVGRPRVFNLASPLGHLLEPLSKKLADTRAPSVAFLSTPVGALEQSVSELAAALPKETKVAERVSFPADATDFKSEISKLKAKSVSTVVLCLLPAQIKSFLEQAHAQRYYPRIFGENTFNDALVSAALRPEQGQPIFVDWVTAPEFDARLDREKVPASHRVEAAQGYFLGTLLLTLAARPSHDSAAMSEFLTHLAPGTSPAGEYAAVSDAFGWHLRFPAALYAVSSGGVRRL